MPLHIALSTENSEIVNELLREINDLNDVDKKSIFTALGGGYVSACDKASSFAFELSTVSVIMSSWPGIDIQ